jgi:hypothetical protein
VVDGKTKKYVPHVYEKPEMTRFMLNYMGFGQDARIGIGFEKLRTTNKSVNDCIYVWEALKKMCCLSNLDPNKRMDYLAVVDEQEQAKLDPDAESVTPMHVNHPEGQNPKAEEVYIDSDYQRIKEDKLKEMGNKSME